MLSPDEIEDLESQLDDLMDIEYATERGDAFNRTCEAFGIHDPALKRELYIEQFRDDET